MSTVDLFEEPERNAPMLDWIRECPCPINFTMVDGKLELYVYCRGERLSLIPTSPDDLWNWLQEFIKDHYYALRLLGLKPLTNKKDDLAGVNVDALLRKLQQLNLEER